MVSGGPGYYLLLNKRYTLNLQANAGYESRERDTLFGVPSDDGVEITLALSQEELAAWTASSREAVAKAMRLLRELGWIETHRRRVVVRDIESLRRYAA